ncbi:hypothetical protein DFH27DRAFT_648293 [Peziza echinospora]|nr:hypothetical protein DFH27DRAFT_648293 [Peziza echinospora]
MCGPNCSHTLRAAAPAPAAAAPAPAAAAPNPQPPPPTPLQQSPSPGPSVSSSPDSGTPVAGIMTPASTNGGVGSDDEVKNGSYPEVVNGILWGNSGDSSPVEGKFHQEGGHNGCGGGHNHHQQHHHQHGPSQQTNPMWMHHHHHPPPQHSQPQPSRAPPGFFGQGQYLPFVLKPSYPVWNYQLLPPPPPQTYGPPIPFFEQPTYVPYGQPVPVFNGPPGLVIPIFPPQMQNVNAGGCQDGCCPGGPPPPPHPGHSYPYGQGGGGVGWGGYGHGHPAQPAFQQMQMQSGYGGCPDACCQGRADYPGPSFKPTQRKGRYGAEWEAHRHLGVPPAYPSNQNENPWRYQVNGYNGPWHKGQRWRSLPQEQAQTQAPPSVPSHNLHEASKFTSSPPAEDSFNPASYPHLLPFLTPTPTGPPILTQTWRGVLPPLPSPDDKKTPHSSAFLAPNLQGLPRSILAPFAQNLVTTLNGSQKRIVYDHPVVTAYREAWNRRCVERARVLDVAAKGKGFEVDKEWAGGFFKGVGWDEFQRGFRGLVEAGVRWEVLRGFLLMPVVVEGVGGP